jgi:hypothetical protein
VLTGTVVDTAVVEEGAVEGVVEDGTPSVVEELADDVVDVVARLVA